MSVMPEAKPDRTRVTINGFEHLGERAYVIAGDELIEATDEVLGEVAREAMLLSQGAERATQMLYGGDP